MQKSLYEDNEVENQIFFNTRIVRTAEILMFLSNLYKNLGVQEESCLSLKLKHSGLSGRFLSATESRSLFRPFGPSVENEIETNIKVVLSDINKTLPALVRDLLSPVFMLFNFFEIGDKIYDEIVDDFKKGKCS
ncbi:MAG: hypothetical protein ACYSTS_03670 [Planctomycetota bacterium]